MPSVRFDGGPLPSAPSGVPAFQPGEVREVDAELAALLTSNPYFSLVEPASTPAGAPAHSPDVGTSTGSVPPVQEG